jgi:hypothetical protein
MLTKVACAMHHFFSGFVCGFTLGFFMTAIICAFLGVLAVLSLTMDASDLPRCKSKKLSL